MPCAAGQEKGRSPKAASLGLIQLKWEHANRETPCLSFLCSLLFTIFTPARFRPRKCGDAYPGKPFDILIRGRLYPFSMRDSGTKASAPTLSKTEIDLDA